MIIKIEEFKMEYLNKLPFILAVSVALIIGMVSIELKAPSKDIYLRMVISMVVFFAIGTYIKNTIIEIEDEVKIKIEKDELEKEIERQKQQQNNNVNQNANLNNDKNDENNPTFDYKFDEYNEEFSPLTVTDFLSSEDIGKQ